MDTVFEMRRANEGEEVTGTTKQTKKTAILVLLQVKDAVIAWAIANLLITLEQSALVEVTVHEDGSARIKVKS